MESLLDITICSGLGLHINKKSVNKAIKSIPSKCFGVFVTVKRSKYQRLKQWPEEIHGCIGDWSHNYKEMSKKKLFDTIQSVSYKATNIDERKKYFGSIYRDSHAEFEISFMMQPVYTVDVYTGILNTGKKFNNKDFGLIVVGENGTRATYLQDVFKNTSWNHIRDSLVKKAGSTRGVKFYAYKTILFTKEIYKIFNKEYLELYYSGFYTFFNMSYSNFVPYLLDSKNKIHIDKSQNVRNIATIYDLLHFKSHLRSQVLKNIISNLTYYTDKFHDNMEDMRQGSAFLLLALHKLKLYPKDRKKICKYLYDSIPYLEKQFELGEVLIALNTSCPDKKILLREQRNMYNSLLKNVSVRINNIFEYNWHAKFLYSLYKQKITKNCYNSYVFQHVQELIRRILHILPKINEQSETNYLAVAFEALQSLLPLACNKKDKIEIHDNIIQLFYMLGKRYKNGLFYFNNNTVRLDISGHVINGLII